MIYGQITCAHCKAIIVKRRANQKYCHWLEKPCSKTASKYRWDARQKQKKKV